MYLVCSSVGYLLFSFFFLTDYRISHCVSEQIDINENKVKMF